MLYINKYRSTKPEAESIITSIYRVNSDAVAVATRKEKFEKKKTKRIQLSRREIRFEEHFDMCISQIHPPCNLAILSQFISTMPLTLSLSRTPPNPPNPHLTRLNIPVQRRPRPLGGNPPGGAVASVVLHTSTVVVLSGSITNVVVSIGYITRTYQHKAKETSCLFYHPTHQESNRKEKLTTPGP